MLVGNYAYRDDGKGKLIDDNVNLFMKNWKVIIYEIDSDFKKGAIEKPATNEVGLVTTKLYKARAFQHFIPVSEKMFEELLASPDHKMPEMLANRIMEMAISSSDRLSNKEGESFGFVQSMRIYVAPPKALAYIRTL